MISTRVSSLNSYPALLRALGLVFDLELPVDFRGPDRPGFGTLSVAQAVWDWAVDKLAGNEDGYVRPAGRE